jgi:hypothetical protein
MGDASYVLLYLRLPKAGHRFAARITESQNWLQLRSRIAGRVAFMKASLNCGGGETAQRRSVHASIGSRLWPHVRTGCIVAGGDSSRLQFLCSTDEHVCTEIRLGAVDPWSLPAGHGVGHADLSNCAGRAFPGPVCFLNSHRGVGATRFCKTCGSRWHGPRPGADPTAHRNSHGTRHLSHPAAGGVRGLAKRLSLINGGGSSTISRLASGPPMRK